MTVRHDTSSFIGFLAGNGKAPADWRGVDVLGLRSWVIRVPGWQASREVSATDPDKSGACGLCDSHISSELQLLCGFLRQAVGQKKCVRRGYLLYSDHWDECVPPKTRVVLGRDCRNSDRCDCALGTACGKRCRSPCVACPVTGGIHRADDPAQSATSIHRSLHRTRARCAHAWSLISTSSTLPARLNTLRVFF